MKIKVTWLRKKYKICHFIPDALSHPVASYSICVCVGIPCDICMAIIFSPTTDLCIESDRQVKMSGGKRFLSSSSFSDKLSISLSASRFSSISAWPNIWSKLSVLSGRRKIILVDFGALSFLFICVIDKLPGGFRKVWAEKKPTCVELGEKPPRANANPT